MYKNFKPLFLGVFVINVFVCCLNYCTRKAFQKNSSDQLHKINRIEIEKENYQVKVLKHTKNHYEI